ncbi:MAG: metal-dependent phosphohydrolase [Acholeplasma sp.]|jgi:3'-5' exoribonuclease|nr:metal-dependent phosphohydrolase [Acholeplasma sp.]
MEFNAKVDNMNVGSDFQNINVTLVNGDKKNLKLTDEQARKIELGKTYHFEVESYLKDEKEQFKVLSFVGIFEYIQDPVQLKEELRNFYEYAPVDMKALRDSIHSYMNAIENKVLSDITKAIFKQYEHSFFMFPAAVRFHHAYIGGLAYHTKVMLDTAKQFADIYPYLNKDLLYSGILLHDICKVDELNGFEGGEYTLEGQLIGHLVMASIKVAETARTLGYDKEEAVLVLNHILLSHHGLPNFGAARKPATAEAMLIWYIDTIDSKFTVLGEELEKTQPGDFTQGIAVLDKTRFYKTKL